MGCECSEGRDGTGRDGTGRDGTGRDGRVEKVSAVRRDGRVAKGPALQQANICKYLCYPKLQKLLIILAIVPVRWTQEDV